MPKVRFDTISKSEVTVVIKFDAQSRRPVVVEIIIAPYLKSGQ
jgi:hypothetical protein